MPLKHAVLMLTLAVSACVPPRVSPEVTRRYASREFANDPNERSVGITAFAVPVPARPPASNGITTLAPEAQAEVVKAVAEHTTGPGPLAEALGLPIGGGGGAPPLRDLTRVSRRLVFSVENRSRGPADRVSEARIYIWPLGDTRFLGWDRIENRYEQVDLGKLNLTRGVTNTAEVGATLPIVALAPKVTTSANTSLVEDVSLQQRYAALTGALGGQEAVLLQQGATGIDLTGTVTADIDFGLPRGQDLLVRNVSIPLKNGEPDCSGRPAFQRQLVRYPRTADSVRVNTVLEYTLRHVRWGDHTITESDDSVVFRSGRDSTLNVLVIPGEDLRFSVYELHQGTGVMEIREEREARSSVLQLASFDDADGLLRWLRTCGVQPRGYRLSIAGRDLRRGDLRSMTVFLLAMNWKA